VNGQPITWLVPHQFNQILPVDVDYKVMLTFMHFYETLIRFVNFKLYHDLGYDYPPKIGMLLLLSIS
jgi:pescadillo protein